jgi:hypothetical protein
MRDVIKVHVFRCVGKVNAQVVYRINVVALGHKHAERTCALWLDKTHPNMASVKPSRVKWQCKLVKMDNPIYMEWEDVADGD